MAPGRPAPNIRHMGTTYAVSWRDSGGSTDSGRLEFGPRALRLEGAGTVDIDYRDLAAVSIGRGSGDRLGGRTAVVLMRRDGRPFWIAPVTQHTALLELHGRLTAALSGDVLSAQ
jgi:hypothetical protein